VWRFVKEQAITGALGDLGCHMIDLMRFITGREFTRLTADYDTFIYKRPMPGGSGGEADVTVDDYIDIAGQMEERIAANLSITRFAYSRGNYQRIEIYGGNGAVRYLLDAGNQLEINGCGLADSWETIPVPEQYKASQMQSFADILNGCGDGLAADMHDGWQTQKVLDAAIIAAENIIKL
jgi:predicted dehydrogenase